MSSWYDIINGYKYKWYSCVNMELLLDVCCQALVDSRCIINDVLVTDPAKSVFIVMGKILVMLSSIDIYLYIYIYIYIFLFFFSFILFYYFSVRDLLMVMTIWWVVVISAIVWLLSNGYDWYDVNRIWYLH